VWLSALAVGFFQVMGSYGASQNQTERRSIDAIAVVLLLLGPAALAWRDRRPLVAVAVAAGAADLYIARGHPYGPIFLSLVVAIHTAVQVADRRSTYLLTAASYLGFIVASSFDVRADDDGVGVLKWALVAGWLALVLAVSEVVKARREQRDEHLRAAHDERQRRIGEQRLSLAQELHDVLAHNISLINVQASVALHLLDEQPDQARPALTNIKDASREALHELRTALDVLRRGEDAPRSPAPRLSDLEGLVAGHRSSGLDVRLDVDELPDPLPSAVELAAFRIVQEALTNVRRHARATAVTIRLGYHDGIDVEVVDDGVGGDATPGNGIRGMGERATALGGTVEAGPAPGGGFRVTAHLPVRPVRPAPTS
jgi:signal transduction histidine kinase